MTKPRDRTIDAVIALAACATLVAAGASAQPGPLGWIALLAGGVALVARRRAPLTVLVTTGLSAVAYQALGVDLPAVAYLVAVYTAVRCGHRWVPVLVSLGMLAGLPAAILVSGGHDLAQALGQARGALEIAWLVAAGAAGEALRQAERRADEAERTREETARRRAHQERLSIARELHDSLTHQISVIKVHAEAAVHVAERRGEQVADPLVAIREAAREAARELRATLELLRDDDTVPPPGLADLPELVDRIRAAGLPVSLQVDGTRAGTPTAVDRTVFRLVQEALTNVMRHAEAATATVRVSHRPDRVTVTVDDDGSAAPDRTATPGVGLLGMRERVDALGGRLTAGTRDGGGFTVHAEFPVEPAT